MHTNIRIDESNKYEKYGRLMFAKIDCENDDQCIGIHDAYCDGEGPFFLLTSGFVTVVPSLDCIHKKRRYDGRDPLLHLTSTD